MKPATFNLQPRAGAHAAKQGIPAEEALKKGMEEKTREFNEKGSELYAKA